MKNPLAWLKAEVKADRFDPYLAALVIIATPALLVWIMVEVWFIVFR